MNHDLQEAVSFLANLLWLKTAKVDAGERTQLDALNDDILDAAFADVERLRNDFAEQRRVLAERVVEAQEQAERDVIAADEKAARDLVQEEADQKQRDERQRAGVS